MILCNIELPDLAMHARQTIMICKDKKGKFSSVNITFNHIVVLSDNCQPVGQLINCNLVYTITLRSLSVIGSKSHDVTCPVFDVNLSRYSQI